MTDTASNDPPIRLIVTQPALPKYRVPVFRELASRPGIDMELLYGERPGLKNVEPDGFRARFVPMKTRRVLGRGVLSHPAQWESSTRDAADVVIYSWDLHYVGLLPSLRRAKKHGVGRVLWGHGYSKSDAGWRRTLRLRSARLADSLLLYNNIATGSIRDSGIPDERIFVALNCLDQTPIQQARGMWLEPGRLEAFRAERSLRGPLVTFVSRFDEANRLDLLIDATAILKDRFPELTIAIIGKGEIEADLKAHAASRGVSEQVRFLGAIYDEAEIAPWFLAADCFCYPANIGLSILHAMGYGAPVVTSDDTSSQNPEIEALEVGVNGLTYRHGDADALASALASIFEDDAKRSAMQAAAHSTATGRFALERMVDGMEAAVRQAHRAAAGR